MGGAKHATGDFLHHSRKLSTPDFREFALTALTSGPMPSKTAQGKLRRRLVWTILLTGAMGLTAWTLVHHTSWAGPLFANSLRAVIGTEGVAKLEDFAYGIEDRINALRLRGEKPKAHWTVPANKPRAPSPMPNKGIEWPAFEPKSVGPVHKSWSAPGDGEWVTVDDPRRPGSNVVMYKTLVHPDEHRSWAELFVVAIDLEQADLHAASGTREPVPELPIPKNFARPGKVPDADLEGLLGAFNGGFMAEHGHYGMRVSGVTLLKPRETSCTIAGYSDGTVEIATWKFLAQAADRMDWFRQTPACMYENNVMHVGLRHPETRNWGATLDGDTVIRRSAIGLDESRRVLFVGISNHTTARALAEGMHHAGAVDVAQLDVNWSYPKFLIYAPGSERGVAATAVMEGFEYTAGDYVTKSSLRDFFYVTRRKAPRSRKPAQEAANSSDAGAESVGVVNTTPPDVATASPSGLRASSESPTICPNCPK